MKFSVKKLRDKQNRVCYNWGFQFALWCALLWGTCYQILEILISGNEFLQINTIDRNPYAVGTVLSIVLAIMITGISFIWVAATNDIREIKKTLCVSKKLNFYILLEAVIGGIAAWATYVTAGLLNTLFAVIGVMFYPILGSILSKKWMKEKVTAKVKLGMVIIFAGWGLFYFTTILNGSWGDDVWIGCFLGILTGIGWGVEGVISSKLGDMIDCDTGVAVRFLYETIVWLLLFFFITVFFPNNTIWLSLKLLCSDLHSIFMLFIIALCLTFNYFSWYRAFALIGVTKGLVISDVSGFASVGIGMLLATSMPTWLEIIASLIMIFGVFFIYWYGIQEIGNFRNVDQTPGFIKNRVPKQYENKPLKIQILQLISINGPIWDFEVANMLSEQITNLKKRRRYRNRIRTYMIEACLSGVLINMEDETDEAGHFQKGKLLSKYQITQFGIEILVKNRL